MNLGGHHTSKNSVKNYKNRGAELGNLIFSCERITTAKKRKFFFLF